MIPSSIVAAMLFMLIAGVLSGYLIWHRDSASDDAKVRSLEAENSDLQTALYDHKQDYLTLEEDLEDRRKELEQFRSLHRQFELSQQESDRDLAELNQEIVRLQQLKDQAFHDLDQERQQRRTLEDSLRETDEAHSDVRDMLEQLQQEVQCGNVSLQDQLHNKQQEHDELKQQKQQLERELELHKRVGVREFDVLADEKNNATRRVEELQQERDHLATELSIVGESLGRLQSEVLQREEDLASLRRDRDDLLDQINDERLSREKLEEQLGNVEDLVAQRDAALAEAECQRASSCELRRELAQHEQSMVDRADEVHAEVLEQKDALAAQLDALNQNRDAIAAMLADERTRLSKLESDNHRLAISLSDANERIALTTQELDQTKAGESSAHERLREELEETAAKLVREQYQREHLQDVLHARNLAEEQRHKQESRSNVEIVELRKRNECLLVQAEELVSLRGEHESVKQILSKTYQQSSQHRAAYEEAVTEIRKLAAQAAERENNVDQLRATELRAEATVHEAEVRIDQLQEENSALQHRLREAVAQIEAWEDQAMEHNESNDRLNKLIAQRDEAMEAHAQKAAMADRLQQQVELQSRNLSGLQQKLAQLQHSRFDSSETNEPEFDTVLIQRDEYASQVQELRQQVERMEARAKNNEETIRNLRRERAAVVTRSGQASSASLASLAVRSVHEESGGRMRRDEVLGMVYTQPPKHKDDLKRITGIASVLEKKLNAFGVYTYRQIMEWDAVAVEEFSKLLAFRDRIERDDWIGQARNLQYETHGRAA